MAHAREPGSSSKQQVQAHLESQENPKRRRRSDDEYKNPINLSLDTITAKLTKSNMEHTGEYTKTITTDIPHSDTSASGSGDAETLTTTEANTDQALDTIPVKPIKNPTEDTDNTPITPQGDNLEAGINDTASLTATEEETHILQTQTAPTDEAWPRHRNPKSDRVTNSPTPGTSSKQHVETLIENLGNCKRTRGSDDEHLSDNPEAGSIDEFWQSQRNATSNTVPNSPSPGNSSKQQVETIIEPNDTTSRPDTSKCIQVGSKYLCP